MPKQLFLQPFNVDDHDSYHFLLAELSPVVLADIPEADAGDLFHPASIFSDSNPGLYSYTQIQSLHSYIPDGPLYSSSEALELALGIQSSGLPNWRSCQIQVKSHLNIAALEFLLSSYTDPWVIRGSKYGWPLSRDPELQLSGITWPNHTSCDAHLDQVHEFLDNEIGLGAVFSLGFAPDQLCPPISTIPLLCVPKPPSKTRVRVCGDMSFPPGFSVNDGIPTDTYEGEPYRCRLPSIWDFIAQIRRIGIEDAVIAKADFSRGYRQLIVDPADWLKQMFIINDKGYMMDTRAIFGGRPCSSFMQITHQALAWAAVNASVSINQQALDSSSSTDKAYSRACSPYIDDSLLVAHKACASSVWDNLLAVFNSANVKLSSTEGHVCPPSRVMRALGFDIDLDSGTVSLPLHKLHEMLDFANFLLSSPVVTRQDIKKLLGRISRCIMVIIEG